MDKNLAPSVHRERKALYDARRAERLRPHRAEITAHFQRKIDNGDYNTRTGL
jgi:hypothetical protein